MLRRLTTAVLLWAPLAPAAGSDACAVCHRAVFDSYRQTPMAASSGETGRAATPESFAHAAFTHRPSGFRYRVYRNRQGTFVEFEKAADGSLHGTKALSYFVGSGAVARSYLLAADGFLYEAPVAWYSAGSKWELAPGYERYGYPFLTRPALPGCLACHASFLDSVPGTQNRYRTPPFREGGVACERCHGPGEAHIAKMSSGDSEGGAAIVNPSKLDPGRRDAICAQCHLSGEVRVMRPGADWQSYHPGDLLSDSLTVFVRSGGSPGLRVTSHVENLAQSACRRASGDGLWCGTCHDPHALPRAADRAAWFRRKCLGCHGADACRETAVARAARRDDCTACHMPKNPVTDAEHVVYTDHSIPRRPRPPAAPPHQDAELAPFGGGPASARDLALAYGITASRQGGAADLPRATTLLEAAERSSPDDVEVLLYLAEIYRNGDRDDRASPLYRRAMGLDPAQVTASVGLGAIHFQRGEYAEAIRLWEDALSKNSGLQLVRTNLAMAQWRAGDWRAAEASLEKALELSPGFQPAADLLARLRQAERPR